MKLIDEEVLNWFRGLVCELCESRPGEPHHLLARGMGGGSRMDHPFNLLTVCRVCHERIHAMAEPTARELATIIAQREGVSVDTVVEFIAWLLRQDKDRPIGATKCSPLSSR